ncbi:uncharacterized protein [Haliotis cracherodii]
MCAAGHKPDTFEFVARMGRFSFGTDGDEKEEDSKDKVPLSFIIPALPNRAKGRERLGRNQRAAKSVDIDTDFDDGHIRQGKLSSQSDDFDNRRGKKGKSDQGLSRRSSDDILSRISERRKRHEQEVARKHTEQHADNETV